MLVASKNDHAMPMNASFDVGTKIGIIRIGIVAVAVTTSGYNYIAVAAIIVGTGAAAVMALLSLSVCSRGSSRVAAHGN